MFGRSLVSPDQARLLAERARAMRFSPTRSEERLWRRLSGSKTGFGFRRQLVIGNFIVDFASTKVRLVVEIDGGYHERRQHRDAAREQALAKLGWTVLRFAEHSVLEDLGAVVERIGAFAAESFTGR
jgi:very-short-patch-repair endonuclease